MLSKTSFYLIYNHKLQKHQKTPCQSSASNTDTKKICAADGCQTKLNTINEYTCKLCHKELCLKYYLC